MFYKRMFRFSFNRTFLSDFEARLRSVFTNEELSHFSVQDRGESARICICTFLITLNVPEILEWDDVMMYSRIVLALKQTTGQLKLNVFTVHLAEELDLAICGSRREQVSIAA